LFLVGDSPASEFYANFSEHSIYPFFIGVVNIFLLTPPLKMERTECSETSACNIQTPENHPKERIQRSEHDESLK